MTRIIPYELIKHLEWEPGKEVPKQQTVKQPQPVQQKRIGIDELVNNGNAFSDSNLVDALRNAMNHATEDGVVASMPYLIAGKANSDKENYLWKNWFTTLSEEDVGIDKEGKFTERGKPLVVTVHGGGILTPDRIQQAYDEGLTDKRAAKFTKEEFNGLLNGTLPSGESIELYTHDDIINGSNQNPFGRYGVVLDWDTARSIQSGYLKQTKFMHSPLVHARAGTLEYLESYFDKAKDSDEEVRNSHLLNDINPEQQQARLLFLNYDHNGLIGYNLDYNGRFVGVAPEARASR